MNYADLVFFKNTAEARPITETKNKNPFTYFPFISCNPEIMDTLAIIPGRGGSKGIRRKNIKNLFGKPLITHTIEAANNSSAIDRTIVSTDDEEISEVAENSGAEIPFMRPAELAADDTPTEPVVRHALTQLDNEFSEFVLLQPTSPLRTAQHIDEAFEQYASTESTSLLSVYRTHGYRWVQTEEEAQQVSYGGERSRRQDRRSEYTENGAIYITDFDMFMKDSDFMAGTTVLYEMSERASIDIDEPFDLWLAEQIKQYQQKDTESDPNPY